MAKFPFKNRTREFVNAGVSNTRQLDERMGDTDNFRTQERTLADGTKVIYRTKGGMPQVFGDKQTTSLKLGMDSGVVNLVDANFVPNAHSYDDGLLLRTTYVNDYVVASGTSSPDIPIIDEIKPPGTKGTAPANNTTAKSYRKKIAANAGALYTRKRVAILCPPSVFAGRTRLYVQALYGRHDSLNNVAIGPGSGTGTPSIVVAGVDITTNCGVYFDATTAKHYLISVGAGVVTIYTLKSSEAGEKLRQKLLDGSISAANKERIEAYILSQTFPAQGGIVTLSIPYSITGSMGYGWHFNWSGTTCNIVVNSIVVDGSGVGENESIHYQLTFAKSGNTWTVTPSTVEGPTRWKNNRHLHPITGPNWAANGLEKFGAANPKTPYGDAPFYAFYVKDTLKVCRYSAGSTAHSKTATRSPWYLSPLAVSTTIGEDAASFERRNAWTAVSVSISCGSESVSLESGGYSSDYYQHSSPDAAGGTFVGFGPGSLISTGAPEFVNSGQPGTIPTSTVYDEYTGNVSAFTGGPVSGYPQISVTVPAGLHGENGVIQCTVGVVEFTRATSIETEAIAAIPFYDAEAVYLYGRSITSTLDSGTQYTARGNFFNGYRVYETGARLSAWGASAAPVSNGDNVAYSASSTATAEQATLVCGAGSFLATIPTPNTFFNTGYDTVPITLSTYSSAHGSSVYSSSTTVSSGLAPADLSTGIPFSFVGWA